MEKMKKMGKTELINEIVKFSFEYGLLKNKAEIEQIKENIGKQLDDVMFIEIIYNAILNKAIENKMLGNTMGLLVVLWNLKKELEDNDSLKSLVAFNNMGRL